MVGTSLNFESVSVRSAATNKSSQAHHCRSTAGGRPRCPGVNVQCYEIETLICGLLNQPPKDYSEEVQAIAAAWSQLTEDAKRIVLPAILSKAVLQMSAGEITLALVDDAAEIVVEAAERQPA